MSSTKINIHNPKIISLICVAIGSIIFTLNMLFYQQKPQLFSILNLIAGLVALGIPVFITYKDYKKREEIINTLPIFLNDLKENIDVGMTLPQGLKQTKNNEYGILDHYVKEMAAKIDWGISFEKILKDFAAKVKSPVIIRTITTVIEAQRSGGDIATVLESVSNSVKQIDKIKKERSTRIYSQMMNGYIIFLLFLGVMFGLTIILLPSLQSRGMTQMDLTKVFNEVMLSLIIIEGFFAGLAIGKLSEGTFIGGLKHSLVLITIGYTAYIILI